MISFGVYTKATLSEVKSPIVQ